MKVAEFDLDTSAVKVDHVDEMLLEKEVDKFQDEETDEQALAQLDLRLNYKKSSFTVK